jgi:NADP-dependent 3-hydroxy acid dehydrogenase YdfG
MKTNEKKTVLITGTSSGIGKDTALFFHNKGWNVAATMRNPKAETKLNQLENVKCFKLDVCDFSSAKSAIADTIQEFGRIDVVVNNAGVYAIGPFEAATAEQIKRQFDTNLFGVMNVIKAALPHFRNNKAGMFINLSSIAGRTVSPLQTLYHGTKWAIEGFSESLQYELRYYNITIKLIEPGLIKTGFSNVAGNTLMILKDRSLSVYDDYADNIVSNLIKGNAEGSDPKGVAKVIYTAATDNKNKFIYPTGKSAHLVLFLGKILPRNWFHKIIEHALQK